MTARSGTTNSASLIHIGKLRKSAPREETEGQERGDAGQQCRVPATQEEDTLESCHTAGHSRATTLSAVCPTPKQQQQHPIAGLESAERVDH